MPEATAEAGESKEMRGVSGPGTCIIIVSIRSFDEMCSDDGLESFLMRDAQCNPWIELSCDPTVKNSGSRPRPGGPT